MPQNAHRLVAKTAKGLAESLYEDVMHDNTLYALWKAICPELTPKLLRAQFVKMLIPHLLDTAVATLAGMLRGNYPEHLKDEIADALIKDAALGRKPPTPARQHLTLQ